MKQISLPYIDQPIAFWDDLSLRFKNQLWEIYFPMSNHIVSTGRPAQPEIHLNKFLEKSDLPKTVLINSIVLYKPVEQVKDLILNELLMLNNYYGINKVTVANLLLCRAIRQELPAFHINASVLMGIKNAEQIAYLPDEIDEITLDTSILRNITQLRAIRRTCTKSIKLIVNEGCLPYCPLRTQHFYEMSCDSILPESLCYRLLQEMPWLRLKSAWVLPQYLHLYNGLFDVIKLAGRVTLQNPDKYRSVLTAYLEETALSAHEIGCGPAGMIEPMEITREFYHHTLHCNKKCNKCNYCKEYYEKHKAI